MRNVLKWIACIIAAILGLGVLIAGGAILAGLLILASVVGAIVLAAAGIRAWYEYRASRS